MERGGSSRPNSFYSQTSSSSCCSLSDSRAEMRDLMDSFIADVQRIRETFADSAAPSGHTAPPARSDGDVEMAPPVPGAYEIERPSTPLEKYEHKGTWCDSCRQKVMGIRHKCLDCYNFDLCNSCMTTKDIQSTHADMPHTFEAVYPPKPKPAPKPTARGGSRPSSPLPKCLCSVLPRPLGCEVCKPNKVGKTAAPQRTLSYRCDSCQNIIGGNRHKCMNCPDFDLCEACYTSGFPVFDHSPVHRFMHIEHPVRVYTAPAMTVSDTTSPLTGGCTHEGSRYKCENCDDVDLCMACLGSLENATIQHAAWHNEQRSDKPVRLVPYNKDTKLQTPKPSAAPLAVHSADCDACDKTIVGTRHKCVVCHDFDLCDACFNLGAEPMSHKTEHEMLHLERPQRIVTHLAGFGRGPITRPVATSSTGTNTPRAVHNAWCDACSERIRGVRHKCLDCLDFDYCDACIEQSATHHNGEHEFYALVEPGQVVVRGISEEPVRARGRPHTNIQSLPPSIPAPPAPPVVPPAHQAPRPARPSQPSHSAACDMCSSRIRGVRYKCTACPDYDVCESCFRVSEEVHPGHSFAKVYKQGDIIARKSAQSSFRHHAKCDVCQNQIFGVRYKCIHPSCPDFDICERCEAMPFAVHPETHAFVKLKSHISNYDGLRNVFSFAANRSQNFQTQSMAVPVPAPTVRIPTPRAFSSPLGVYHEPMTGTEVFHTATPSPIVPLSTLGCTIVPHTTIVPSLPQTPEPLRMLPQVPSPAIPSPTPERKLTDSWSAAASSAKLDEHKMHHSDMYKPSYEPPVVEAQPRGRRTNAVEVSGPHSVTVQEERDPEAPQMALVNSRPVSLPDVPMHEPVVSREPTPSIIRVASPEVIAPVAVHESIPQIIRVTSPPPYAFGHQVLRTPRVRTPSPPPPPQIIRIGSPDFSRIPQPEVIRVGTSPATPERVPHIVYVPTVDSSSIPEVIRDSTPSASYGPRVVRVPSPILRPEVIRVSSPVSSSLGPQVVRIGSPTRDQSPSPVVHTASAESSNAPSPQVVRVGSATPPEPEIIRIGTPIARPEPIVVRVPSPDVSSAPSSVVSRISTPPLPDTEPKAVRAVESEVIVVPESIPASPEPELPGLLPAYPYRPASPEPGSPIPDMVSLASSPSPSISSASIVSYTSPYEAAFIEDRTIVDGQVVSCGAEFTKIWRMRNTGTVAWPQGTTVSFVGGHYLTTAVHWPVNGDLSPGQDIEVEVEMKAPEEPGHYHSTWRLKTPEGEAFGSVVWCDINVAEIERAGSSGNSEVSASSIIVPTRAPGMSVATMSTTPASPEVQSVSSTIRTSSVTDMADDDDDISIGSEDSLDLVWEEVRRRGQGQ